jgi:hypothetical protein
VNQLVNEKVRVLEIAQQAQVDGQGEEQPSFCAFVVCPVCFDAPTDCVIDKGREDNQEKEPRVPPAVKHITGQQQKQVLPTQVNAAIHQPIQAENQGQKQQKFQGIEKHAQGLTDLYTSGNGWNRALFAKPSGQTTRSNPAASITSPAGPY